jgi:cell shape-determining protein MreC
MIKNLRIKAFNFLLVILGIFLISSDIFNSRAFSQKKIIIENFVSFPSLNIDKLSSKIFKIRYIISSYVHDINNVNNLIEENGDLKNEIIRLKVQNKLVDFYKSQQNNPLYSKFKFLPVEIISQDKNYGMIATQPKINIGDLVINECMIIGKIGYIGNQNSIMLLNQNKKLLLPFIIKDSNNNTGLYSTSENKILEIKKFSDLKVDNILVTYEKNNRLPNGIEIGKISSIENNNISVQQKQCENQSFGFIITGSKK